MDQASEVREKIDLVNLISEYVPLKKVGRNFTAACPFHNEKSPSFVVSPERQIWHCFGCGKGGDCFTFLMEYENLEFIEALRTLAKKAGIELKSSSFSAGQSNFKEKIYTMNKMALEYYHYVLTSLPAGMNALQYLTETRLLNTNLVDTFSLGFAPLGDGLSQYLIKKKRYTPQELIDAGLSFRRGSGVSDFFRNRIIFPLMDHRGNVVGFSGRVFGDIEDGPKYINTKETVVYHKGSTFFGLNRAKEEIKKTKTVLIMEGELDVITAFKEGITNAVAIKGTAFTDSQALLISRFAENVVLCLDQDDAGFEATKRSLPILEKRNLTVSIVKTPNGKDPDEILNENPIVFKKTLKEHTGIYDFLISYYLSTFDSQTAQGKKDISGNLLPLFSFIQNEVIKEHYLKKLSEVLDTSVESLIRQMEKNEDKFPSEEKNVLQKDKRDRQEMLEEYFLSLIMQADNPRDFFQKKLDFLIIYKFKILAYQKIIDNLIEYFKNSEEFDSRKFINVLPKELASYFDKLFLMPLPKFEDLSKYEAEIERVARDLKGFYLKERIREISKKLKVLKDEKEINALQKEFTEVTSQLSNA